MISVPLGTLTSFPSMVTVTRPFAFPPLIGAPPNRSERSERDSWGDSSQHLAQLDLRSLGHHLGQDAASAAGAGAGSFEPRAHFAKRTTAQSHVLLVLVAEVLDGGVDGRDGA